eukprot:CAMPEP_0178582422 /NCGR_PEP_ID=MMETSP0697-20121206/23718_1 /TAXON_ID=265572 /ORGANISM="Extubocellulus spinifer, Strain CCMP396" /LENGTH=747 /DNA_ID=CAMNT_0020218157 /DNA_START=217 /DNA_END=2463 /DNA_ORIENTATION=+
MFRPRSNVLALLVVLLASASTLNLVSAGLPVAEQNLCTELPPPTEPCTLFRSWEEFSETLLSASGELVLCPGNWITKPSAEAPAAIIKLDLRLSCSVPGKCVIRGPGRHIKIKTDETKRVIIDGIMFEGSDYTSITVIDYASAQHLLCDNRFINNGRPVESPKGGGAIIAGVATNLVIGNSLFRKNEARVGGAISFAGDSLRILDSTFEDNAAVQGGAIEASSPAARIEVGKTTFVGNTATDDGGASSAILITSGEDWVDLGGNAAVDAACNGAYARVAGSSSIDPDRCFGFIDEDEEIIDWEVPDPSTVDDSDSHDDPDTYEEQVQAGLDDNEQQDQQQQQQQQQQSPPLALGTGLYRDSRTGLQVAQGLKVRSFARQLQPVQYRDGRNSGSCDFIMKPDGAAAFYDSRHNVDGGFHYCVNAELKFGGGVFCVEFDSDCQAIDYVKRIGGRQDDGCAEPNGQFIPNKRNCNGGSTPWNTWVTCEEVDNDDGGGYCWQVDPYGERTPERVSRIGRGEWEAMAVDDRTSIPVFYFTEDWSEGALRQFTPSPSTLPAGWHSLHPTTADGDLKYLVFNSDRTFYWSSDIREGKQSQERNFPNLEGIAFNVINGNPYLFFVSKRRNMLFQLNLDTGTYTSSPTDPDDRLRDGGSFWSSPDIIVTLGDHFIFHSEDGGNTPGVYFKDLRTNEYLTIFQDDSNFYKGDEETTGVAVSPNGKCLLSCLQERGECFVFEREDGGNFEKLDPRLRI